METNIVFGAILGQWSIKWKLLFRNTAKANDGTPMVANIEMNHMVKGMQIW